MLNGSHARSHKLFVFAFYSHSGYRYHDGEIARRDFPASKYLVSNDEALIKEIIFKTAWTKTDSRKSTEITKFMHDLRGSYF
jgi:hypothetical protein